MPANLVIVRHSGFPDRPVPIAAALAALSPELQALNRKDHEVDTQVFDSQVSQGDWEGQAAFLASEAARIHALVAQFADSEIHYFGLAEIPHVISLGAFIGDEQPVVIHDFDRDTGSWKWPHDAHSVALVTRGIPVGDPVTAQGSAVLRIELSATISDDDVREAAGTNHLAEVRVTFADGAPPEICKVRSPQDLQAVRHEIRSALAALKAKRPNLDTIHVFAAASVSVCFALGQELKPRNSPPIQTYRYRNVPGQPSYKAASELTGDVGGPAEQPLTDEDRGIANSVRDVWREALQEVETYAAAKRSELNKNPGLWYELLEPVELLRQVRPFPPLPAACEVVQFGATVDPKSVGSEYGFSKPNKQWNLSDRLLVALHRATKGEREDLKRLIRLFLFHEYLHDYHSLTKYEAAQVGAFQNCLEHIDYTADSYAILHQLDLQRLRDHTEVGTEAQQKKFLERQVELVVGSFWAFQPAPPILEWQVRRLRRYLNWYWRLVQIQYAPDLLTALRLFSQPPHVELAGLHQFARQQRVFCRLDKLDSSTRPELALVLENHKLLRVPDSTTSNLQQLLIAFQQRDHDAIVRFFLVVYEQAKELRGDLPSS